MSQNKDKYYMCVMLPYPSSDSLHIGHYYNYAIMDSYCRYKRYTGVDVFQPFGFDSYGLPAENYARKHNRDPREVTYENIDKFRIQMKNMNTKFEEKLITSDDSYVKWTQWLFKIMKDNDLAYKKMGAVNYCSSCETVLANEQVKNNKCERCNTEIVQRELEQWYFKLNSYAERLLKNLDTLDYPEGTKRAQREWIGKSEGYEVDFGEIKVFTTKPETISDVKFIVTYSEDNIESQIGTTINPITGDIIPVYTSNYVIKGYGTGYVMGVPNDDKRDREFAIRHNIEFSNEKTTNSIEYPFIQKKVNYRLHDWCISRQRKWGCPIPIEGEEDTLDTFVDSSFYFLRYLTNSEDELIPKEDYKQVDLYVGGNEHACMHLIYARFINMALFDLGYVGEEEPFKKLIHQGMITNNGEKMSKSKGNVINPDSYDADELRFYLSFIGHYFDGGSWDDKNIIGIRRFINRFIEWMSRDGDNIININSFKKTIFAYTESFKFNKVVSEFMILVNKERTKNLNKETKEELINLIEIYMPGIRKKMKNEK